VRRAFGFFLSLFIVITIAAGCSDSQTQEPITMAISALVPQLDLDELTLKADLIVLGNVTSITPNQWDTPDGKPPKDFSISDTSFAYSLFSDISFQVDRILKGKADQVIHIRSYGGQYKQYTLWVEDQPELNNGSAYLLFLYSDSEDFGVLGSYQGVYEIFETNAKSISDPIDWKINDLIEAIQQYLP
jgi:hypothetical protein